MCMMQCNTYILGSDHRPMPRQTISRGYISLGVGKSEIISSMLPINGPVYAFVSSSSLSLSPQKVRLTGQHPWARFGPWASDPGTASQFVARRQ